MTNENPYYDHAGDPKGEERWRSYEALPELPLPGVSVALDSWLDSKCLGRQDLVRMGAKWGTLAGSPAIVYLFPDGLKYRSLEGRRLSETGVNWRRCKLLYRTPGETQKSLVVAEGETDAALLARLALTSPEGFDVAVLPAGAKHVPDGDDWSHYERVYLGHDADEAGDAGAQAYAAWLAPHPDVRRMRPKGGVDWCELAEQLDSPFDPEDWVVEKKRAVWSVKEISVIDFGDDKDNNWFANGLLPIGGELALHGPMKSLKSVAAMEIVRALATATAFAGYVDYLPSAAARVLVVQYEIPPPAFQRRLWGMSRAMGEDEWSLFSQNVSVFGIGDGRRPRLKVNEPGFQATIFEAVEEAEADAVLFDPIQRMTGSASLDKSNEIEPLLDMFDRLMSQRTTVLYCHHDNKAERNSGSPYAMSGSQRFGADADTIGSMYHNKKAMHDDRNESGIKQRNLSWECRNGIVQGRSITARPSEFDSDFMQVTWSEPILHMEEQQEDNSGPSFS